MSLLAYRFGGNGPQALPFPNTLTPYNTTTRLIAHSSSFTVETWVRVTAYSDPPGGFVGADSVQSLFLFSGESGYTLFLRLNVVGGEGALHCYNYNGESVTSPVTLPAKTWGHVRLSYDAVNLSLRIDLNNVTVGKVTLSQPLLDVASFCIGHIDSNRPYAPLNGQLDEIRVWPFVRSDAENAASWHKSNRNLPDLYLATAAWDFEAKNLINGGYYDTTGHDFPLRTSTNGYEQEPVDSTAPLD